MQVVRLAPIFNFIIKNIPLDRRSYKVFETEKSGLGTVQDWYNTTIETYLALN